MPRIVPVAALLAVLAGSAEAFVAQNDLVIEGGGTDSFTVPWRNASGASDFWCAAGDFAIRGLGLSPATRLYRTSPVPRPAGEGVTFSVDATGATDSGLVTFGSPDKGLSAGHARALCLEPRFAAD